MLVVGIGLVTIYRVLLSVSAYASYTPLCTQVCLHIRLRLRVRFRINVSDRVTGRVRVTGRD